MAIPEEILDEVCCCETSHGYRGFLRIRTYGMCVLVVVLFDLYNFAVGFVYMDSHSL